MHDPKSCTCEVAKPRGCGPGYPDLVLTRNLSTVYQFLKPPI